MKLTEEPPTLLALMVFRMAIGSSPLSTLYINKISTDFYDAIMVAERRYNGGRQTL